MEFCFSNVTELQKIFLEKHKRNVVPFKVFAHLDYTLIPGVPPFFKTSVEFLFGIDLRYSLWNASENESC